MNKTTSHMSFAEFVALMALMMALPALSIDAMLPALPMIGSDLAVTNSNDLQLIISSLFLGIGIGQLFYGAFSDSKGRKPAIYLSICIFIIGSLLSIYATNFTVMLFGRFLQGLGAAGPRIVTVALVRDEYEGRAMARVMSFIMTIFILVPVIAPALGQLILLVADWRAIFAMLLLLSVIIAVWFSTRQIETLTASQRVPVSYTRILSEVKEIFSYRASVGYGITSGLIFGALVGYLSSIQPILQDLYGLGSKFALYFGLIATSIGAASLLNAALVMRYGMHLLSRIALVSLTIISIAFLAFISLNPELPALWMLMTYLLLCFFCVGILFGNLNAIAMEPLGHIAGMGAAVIGSLSTFISVPIGVFIGQCYNDTILPLVAGFAALGLASLLVSYWADQTSSDS